ncbi:hypothetical protein ACOMHN_025170 [Nucella lapillus]
MLELPERHPDVYQRFLEGHHSVRRSERYWAGLSSDLVIEQVLMRSLKSNGGLTRGSGMGETERLVWLLSMPACAEVNISMQLVTGLSFATSEQHKDASAARQSRDHKDTQALLHFFYRRNPFLGDGKLRSLATGQEADESVNVDMAKQIGQNILDSMTGSIVSDVKFKKCNQAVTLATKTTISVQGEAIHVDPTLLFQRLVKVAQTSPESLPSCFHYELTNIPTSLFEPSGLPREAKKYELAKFLWSRSKQDNANLPHSVHYVIDGGSLLHRVEWSRSLTYSQLCQTYVDFVTRRYGNASVVFDGYCSGPSTKDVTHMRRKNGRKTTTDIIFDGDMLVCNSRESFLSNQNNKQRFINNLSEALQETGLETYHADRDADCLIVSTVLEKAKKTPAAIAEQDTDLLVLLLYHARPEHCTIYLSTGDKNWDIQAAQAALGADFCRYILFGHALGGCDTTSSLFSLSKGSLMQTLADSPFLQQQADVFTQLSSGHEQVI